MLLQWRTSLQNKSFLVWGCYSRQKSSVNSFETILYFSGLGLSSWDFCQNSWFHLFYLIFLFIFLFWKTLICWRYLNWTKFRCSWNSFWTCSLWSLGGCCWSFRSKWIADIIGLSAAFGCWVVLSLFRRRSELCNNFQFGDLPCVSLCCFTVVSNDLFGVVRNEVAWIHYFYTHLTPHFYTKHMELA